MRDTKCYCDDCAPAGQVKSTYSRKFMSECMERDKAKTAYERARAASQAKAENNEPPPMEEGWWNQEGAPTA